MRPQLALVGRPNVGKSTLFNKLTRARHALVADVPGLTRDRQYGRAAFGGKACVLIDTGGLDADGQFADLVGRQAQAAMVDAFCVLFIVDAQAGLTVGDQLIADDLRRRGRQVVLVVNKIDGLNAEAAAAEFTQLGFVRSALISATQGRGLSALQELLAGLLPAQPAAPDDAAPGQIRTAIVGRPNVGKSTLINRWVGQERQIVFDRPGTTRDAIAVPCRRGGDHYLLIDTAGVRRKGRVEGLVEKFSVVKALQAVEQAHVAVLVIDAREGLVDQDLHVLKIAIDSGAGLVMAVNKWDALGEAERRRCRAALNRRLEFAPWMPLRFVSALEGVGVARVLAEVKAVFRAGRFEVSTTLLNRTLQSLIQEHPPPAVRGRRIKLRYAHRLGAHPPHIGIHGNQTEALPRSYVRYLENGFREAFNLVGSPVRIGLKTSANPYAGKRNLLTPRQQRKRRRIVRHRKGRTQ